MDWLACGPIGQSQCKALSTSSKNDFDSLIRWIYIQRLAFFFNLSSSSSSAAGTACSSLRCTVALLRAPRSETLPYRRPGHPSTPLHLLLFSAECSPSPHPNQSSLTLISVCDSTAASSPSPGHSCPEPRRWPPPWSARHGVVNMVNKRESSEEDCMWRG